uniref:non-specific serine/threonine protein kinase n=1 Tax=Kalanchoe fedtschenkoi TaxID=63787 RepID=A0A7N0T8V1_KALFE
MAAALLFLLIFLLINYSPAAQSEGSNEFIYNGFNGSALSLFGASEVVGNGALMLTNLTSDDIGRAFYPEPMQMFQDSNSSKRPFNFSTYFVFSMIPPANAKGGYGIAFVVSPSTDFPGAKGEHYLGVFNSSDTAEEPDRSILAVEFDTVNRENENYDRTGNHVGINLNNITSLATRAAAYFIDEFRDEDFQMEEEPGVQAWIEYDGGKQVLSVTIAKMNMSKPLRPILSHQIPSSYFKKSMYMGFSASTGRKSSYHYILGWSLRMNGTAQQLNTSQLPAVKRVDSTAPPPPSPSSSYSPRVVGLIVSLTVVVIALGIWLFVVVWRRRMFGHEVLEDWEVDCPHRCRYKDLHMATKGFRDSEMIGAGGFGSVYKGVMPATGSLVAVKKIASNSIQGMREFVAEVESLGRLRHKHLVNLQGWCKRKNELLLVYDYVPNGSLDSLLYNHRSNLILTWETRLSILKGVAVGLLYLHEEWEKVVIHRDIKSNNVLIDADMNPRLGDFGLARLHDHDKASYTTNFVGTIGYIAPETARNGKASASADVFSYGVLMLEVACGRRPLDPDVPGSLMLVEWVIQCQQMGRILDAVDPRLSLDNDGVAEEMEFVLKLGLICSHQRAEARPSMRQVVRYLNRDGQLPGVEDYGESVSSHSADRFVMSRFLEGISSSTGQSVESESLARGSYGSLSHGGISTTSMRNGR